MEKTINIQNKATIQANGKLNSKKCKPVICIDTGEVFTGVTDAAQHAGCSMGNMCDCLGGKTKTVKGNRYCYLSKVTENLNAIITRLRETSAMETDARKWREHEEARKAEEKRQTAITKAEEKVARCMELCEHANQRLMKARYELNTLKGVEVA